MGDLIAISKKDLEQFGENLFANGFNDANFPEMRFYKNDILTLTEHEYVDIAVMIHDESDINKAYLFYDRSQPDVHNPVAPAKLPMVPLTVPDFLGGHDKKLIKDYFRDIIDWNIIKALISVKRAYEVESCQIGLSYGFIDTLGAVMNYFGFEVNSSIMFTSINHSHVYNCEEHCVLVCHLQAMKRVNGQYSSIRAAISYDNIRKYCNAINTGFYIDVYRQAMDAEAHIASERDDRIQKPKLIYTAFDMWKKNVYDKSKT